MAKQCVMVPSVRIINDEGESVIIKSRLWNSIKSGLKELGISSPLELHNATKNIWKKCRKLQSDLGLNGREITLSQASRAVNILDYVSHLRGIDKADILDEITKSQLSKTLSKFGTDRFDYTSAQQAATDFNNEYNDMLPGAIAVVEDVVESNETKYKVVIKDAHYLTPASFLSTDKISDEVASGRARLKAAQALINKIKNACQRFGINIERSLDDKLSNWSLCKESTGNIVAVIQVVNDLSDIDLADVLSEEFSHALIAGLSETGVVRNLLDTLINNDRLVSSILSIDDSYDLYSKKYGNNKEALALEAGGKLLKWQLLNDAGLITNLGLSESMKSVNELLLDKYPDKRDVLMLTKQFEEGLAEAVYSAQSSLRGDLLLSDNDGLLRLATSVLEMSDKELAQAKINFEKGQKSFWQRYVEAAGSDGFKLYDLAQSRNEADHIITRLNDIEMARAHNLRNVEFNDNKKIHLSDDTVRKLTYNKRLTDSIGRYIDLGINELNSIIETLNNVFSPDAFYTIEEKAAYILRSRIICQAYNSSIAAIEDELSGIKSIDNAATREMWEACEVSLRENLTALRRIVNEVESMVKETSIDILAMRIQPYLDAMTTNPFSMSSPERLSARDILRSADKDISFTERWLDSVSQTDDVLCRVIDQMAKEVYDVAKKTTLRDKDQITSIASRLGINANNAKWLYETDSDGVPTGWILSPYRYGAYYAALAKFKHELEADGKKFPSQEYNDAISKWHSVNSIYDDNGELVPNDKWANELYDEYLKDPIKKEFYDFFLSKKRELEAKLPESLRSQYRAIQILRSPMEISDSQISKSGFVGAFTQAAKTTITSALTTKIGDTNYQNSTDCGIQKLSTLFIERIADEDLSRLSLNPVSSLISYACMANNYEAMSKHVSTFEVMRMQAHERSVSGKENGGLTAERIDDFLNTVIYNQHHGKDHTLTIGGLTLSSQKIASSLCSLTFVDKLAGNILSAINNFTIGNVTETLESIGSRYYNHKDLSWAQKELWSQLGNFAFSSLEDSTNNKLRLWLNKFDISQEATYNNLNNLSGQSRLKKAAKNLGGIFYTSGEVMLKMQTALAIANHIHVWDSKSNKEITLYDAFEVVPFSAIDEDAQCDRLVHHDGIYVMQYDSKTKSWEKTNRKLDETYLNQYATHVSSLNRKMHGIYNDFDQPALNKYALGRLALLFHRYIKSGINYRFGKSKYDFNEQRWDEGYMRTAGKFLLNCIIDLSHGKVDIMSNWSVMTDQQRANCRLAVTEYATFASLLGILAVIMGAGWGDDKTSYLKRLSAAIISNSVNSMSLFVPSHKTPSAVKDSVVNFAVISTIEDTIGLLGCLLPSSYSQEIAYGKYAGHSKAYGYFMDSPLGSFVYSSERIFNPEQTIYRGK